METAAGPEHYLSLYKRFEKNGAAGAPAWLRELRKSAIDRFAELGFPTTRDEEWKYTSVEPIARRPFEPDPLGPQAVSGDAVAPLAFTDPAYNRIVFVNGRYAAALSSLRGLPAGVRVGSLSDALSDDGAGLESHIARCAGFREHAFVALNTAFLEDGALVWVPKGQVIEEPLYLVFVSSAEATPVVSQPRNLIVMEEGSQARVVESYVGLGSGFHFANAVTEIAAAAGVVLEYCQLQRKQARAYHVGSLVARLGRDCSFTSHGVVLGGALVRNDVRVTLDGEGSECLLNGLYMVDGEQHVDNHTTIEHLKPRTRSRELYKGVLDGRARGVFNGKILVRKGAQKSDSRQTNKNLLLSPDAVVNTKPQLEIYADDVKCAHGSTIGQLDPDALFYLRSRGLDAAAARSLLTYAFASDVVGRIKVGPIRARLDNYLLTRFKNQ